MTFGGYDPPVADSRVAFTSGFEQGLNELFERHKELWDVVPEDAAEYGRRAAGAAVAPVLWAQAIGERHDTAAVTALLGVSRQALHKRSINGTILGVPGRGTTWFPVWQFDATLRDVRPVVGRIIGTFRDQLGTFDPLAVAAWATTPQPDDLDGSTPEDWIISGQNEDRVVEAARRAARALAQ